MYAEVAWVLVSSGTQNQPQIILDPDYLPDYLSVSYAYDIMNVQYTYIIIIYVPDITFLWILTKECHHF